MKINTDLVKNKKFAKDIQPQTLKHSQEYRVLATLRYLYPQEFNTVIPGESPDLQDYVNGVGIEVTASVTENDMRAMRSFSRLHQENSRDVHEHLRRIADSGYTLNHFGNNRFSISRPGTADGEKAIFQQSIQRKIEKLQRYRENFRILGLAIILPDPPTSYAESHYKEWISELADENNIFFDFIFVISNRFCIRFGIHENTVEKLPLTATEKETLAIIGRLTAEGKLSLNDAEWSID